MAEPLGAPSTHDELQSLADDTFDQIRICRGLSPYADELELAVTRVFGGGAWGRWKQWSTDPAYDHVPAAGSEA